MATFRMVYGDDQDVVTETFENVGSLEREDGWLVIFRGNDAILRVREEHVRSLDRIDIASGRVEAPEAQSNDAFAGLLKRTQVQRSGSSIPGREIVQVRTEIPVGVESGWHTHPGEEVGYIVAGTVQMMVEGQTTLTLHAGEGFLIPPGTPHNALDVGPGTGQMLSTYIVEIGEPLATFVDGPAGTE